jgi:hypothetical protein
MPSSLKFVMADVYSTVLIASQKTFNLAKENMALSVAFLRPCEVRHSFSLGGPLSKHAICSGSAKPTKAATKPSAENIFKYVVESSYGLTS